MRRLPNIAIAVATLVLLAFGTGGLSVAHCACSGKTTLLTMDSGCCPAKSGCMTITTVHLSDSTLPVHTDMPPVQPAGPAPQLRAPAFCATEVPHLSFPKAVDYPPPRAATVAVLRV